MKHNIIRKLLYKVKYISKINEGLILFLAIQKSDFLT